MKSVLMIIFFLCSWCLNGQQVIDMGGYKGVLFADSIGISFRIDSISSRYTPTLSEVHSANELLLNNDDSLINVWGKSFKRELKKSYRQFLGFVDLRGDKHVLIFLLRMKDGKNKSNFKEWAKEPIVGFGDFYERNLKILNVNIDQEKVTVF